MSNEHEDFRTTVARVTANRINQTKRTLITEFTRKAQVKKTDYKEKFLSHILTRNSKNQKRRSDNVKFAI